MDKPPSHRWLWSSVVLLGCAFGLFGVAVITGLAHEPRVVSGTFLVLGPLCGVVSFVLMGVGATKAKKENRQLAARAIAEAHATTRARRG